MDSLLHLTNRMTFIFCYQQKELPKICILVKLRLL